MVDGGTHLWIPEGGNDPHVVDLPFLVNATAAEVRVGLRLGTLFLVDLPRPLGYAVGIVLDPEEPEVARAEVPTVIPEDEAEGATRSGAHALRIATNGGWDGEANGVYVDWRIETS